jgi:hypothetical protein
MEKQRTQIAPFRVRLRYTPQLTQGSEDLINEFFMVYSRFEFTLKKMGYRRIAGDGHVEPNWFSFSSNIQNKFNPGKSPELQQSFDYYLTQPPKVQILVDEELSWRSNQKREKESDFIWVIRSIGIVRNNLFHGGKFPFDPIRDISLLSYGLIILYECLDLDKDFFNTFSFSP